MLYRQLTANEIRCNIPISHEKKIHFFLVILQLFVLSSSDRWAVTHRYIHILCKFLEIKFSSPRNNAEKNLRSTTTHWFHSHQLDMARTLCVEIETLHSNQIFGQAHLPGEMFTNFRCLVIIRLLHSSFAHYTDETFLSSTHTRCNTKINDWYVLVGFQFT